MQAAKFLILTGSVLVLLGLVVAGASFLGISDKLGKLPGDIRIEGKSFSFYFPIVSSLVLSLVLSLILYFANKWKP